MNELSLYPQKKENFETREPEYIEKLEKDFEVLRKGELIQTGIIPDTEYSPGVNKPLLVTLRLVDADDQVREVKAICKPVSREKDNRREDAPHTRFELASTWIATALQFDSYPLSCTRKLIIDGKFQEVFLQFFIEDSKPLDEYKGKKVDGMNEMMVFDYLIWNTDRHYLNCRVKNNKVVPIDHGNSFNNMEDETLKFIVSDMEKKLLNGDISQVMKSVIIDIANPQSELRERLRKRLSGLLTTEEINAFFGRVSLVSNLFVENGNLKDLIEHVLKTNINIDELYNGKLVEGDDELWRVRFFAGRLEKV